ncbi:MAG: sulfite exporter TauE/SafE family protein, partial [Lentimonas sp.]
SVYLLYLIPVLFAAVAFLYAMAGFGGGSTYIALLAISGLPLAAVPIISLICNLVVTSQGSFLLIGKGHANWKLLIPLLSTSIPCAFIGGIWRLPEAVFLNVLALALTVAGLLMLWQTRLKLSEGVAVREPNKGSIALVGSLLGLLAGVTGIGGGIYLAPIMHLFRWSKVQSVAACTSIFIALNSLSGLLGQLGKGTGTLAEVPMWLLVGCPVLVLIGGRFGSAQLSERFSTSRIRMITATVILLVAVRLWVKVFLG